MAQQIVRQESDGGRRTLHSDALHPIRAPREIISVSLPRASHATPLEHAKDALHGFRQICWQRDCMARD